MVDGDEDEDVDVRVGMAVMLWNVAMRHEIEYEV